MEKEFYSITQVEKYFFPKDYEEKRRKELLEKELFWDMGAREISEILEKL